MPHTVMIVDDDRTMNSLLQTLLELDGFNVLLCPRADEVIKVATAKKPNILIMDLHIGDADGLVLLKEIRQHPELKTIPIIMSSGMDKSDECAAAGSNAFILKPYPPDQLTSTINKLLS
jgi:DNA-binding response OmpR family regulator